MPYDSDHVFGVARKADFLLDLSPNERDAIYSFMLTTTPIRSHTLAGLPPQGPSPPSNQHSPNYCLPPLPGRPAGRATERQRATVSFAFIPPKIRS